MKSPILLPTLTALIGFSVAWITKPGAVPTPAVVAPAVQPRPTRPDPGNHKPSLEDKHGSSGKTRDYPLADLAAKGPSSRDEAKMLRLTEALGLTIDQQGSIIKLVEDVQATADGSVSVLADLTTRGKAIEEGLTKVMTPEQLAKFQELRVRERENRIELRSQRMLAQAMEEIDLSAQQRDEILSRLRQKSKAEMQSIPAVATLLLDKSMLPTAGKELSVDGVLLLSQLGDPVPSANPMEAQQKVFDQRREQLEEILKCFDGILSPGQMGQYQAALAEQREILNRLPRPRSEP